MTFAIKGDIGIWGLSIPIDISWNWTPPQYSIPRYDCKSSTHTGTGTKIVQFFAIPKAKVEITRYKCQEVSYRVIDTWSLQGHRITTLTNCE